MSVPPTFEEVGLQVCQDLHLLVASARRTEFQEDDDSALHIASNREELEVYNHRQIRNQLRWIERVSLLL